MTREWFHRTCEHRVGLIEEAGVLRPNPHPILGGIPLVWLTSQRSASRVMLGLTSHTLQCDRMAHLFRVLPEEDDHVVWWGDLKRLDWFEPFLVGARRLEAVRGTRPGLWGVAGAPVRVERLE